MDDFKRTAMLLARGAADLTVYGRTPPFNTLLHCLVLTNKDGANDKEINELLILQKDKVNAKTGNNLTALTSLIDQLMSKQCSMDDFKRTAMLLAHGGADLAVYGSTPPFNTLLHCLVLTNEQEIHDKEVTEILKLKSDIFNIPDGNGLLPLQALLLKQPLISTNAIIKLIILDNALHYKNLNEETLIHTACSIGNLELVQCFVSNGLNIAAKTTSGKTTLHCSVSSNNQALWKWLYEQDVDINAQDNSRRTALLLATQNNNKAMVQWLIEHNADINVQDNFKRTALHLATQKNNKALLQLLIKQNANLLEDENGETALSIAQKNGAQEIIELLLTNPRYKLFATIDSLKKYGVLLKNQGASKGQIAIDLAADLKLQADLFFKKAAMPGEFKAFQDEFSLLLNSKNQEMSEYRTCWSTIIANIAIALTGIGALLLVGQLIYTQVTLGRPLFFLQKNQTTSEEMVGEVRQAMLSLGSN